VSLLERFEVMKQSLRERLQRLGPISDIVHVSGSPVDIVLSVGPDLAQVKSITAIEAIARRGVGLSVAKRAIETVVERGETTLHVPSVESMDTFRRDLLAAGISSDTAAAAPPR
jgi:hypothetical protein